MQRVLGVIPARFASTRFPGKPLASLGDKSMIALVWLAARRARRLDRLIIATDDRRIADEAALELGVTYFDTAPGYGQGESESIFGKALDGVGDRAFVATKVGIGADVRQSAEASLKRLRRDCLDLLQIHGGSYTPSMADAILAPGGMLDQMERLKAEGLVRFIGFTTEDQNPAVYRFIETGRFDVVQITGLIARRIVCHNLRPKLEQDHIKKLAYLTLRNGIADVNLDLLPINKWVRIEKAQPFKKAVYRALPIIFSTPAT